MKWVRTRYGFPVICYHWLVGAAGVLLMLYCTFHPPFPSEQFVVLAFLPFLIMHIVASFLHFQYARLNVVITFESSFTTATLLVFGSLPAVWVSVIGIVLGSIKRVIERRYILHKPTPLSYDLGIILFNSGMTGTMWLTASWVYISWLKGDIPLLHLGMNNILTIVLMFVSLSILNHIILFLSSYLQGLDPILFIKKALVPAFLTEFATIPFGVVMALAFTRMGGLAFFFLGTTLLLSNAVLRNLSIIRYDQEEKLRQLTALNTISRQIISLRDKEAVVNLLHAEVGKIVETDNFFLAEIGPDEKRLHFFTNEPNPNSVLHKMAQRVAETKHPFLITNSRKEAPKDLKAGLLSEEVRSCIIIPLLAGSKMHGVMGVYSKEVEALKRDHMKVLVMVADEAALALENSKLYSDLTDKVSELEHLNKELRQLDKLKSEFLANVSHELRTPLTSIKGYVEYIKKEKLGPITPLQNEGLTVAQRNVLRLQRLINDLLDYTRLEFKKTPLVLGARSLEKMWTEAYDEYAEAIAGKKLSLHVTIPPDLPLLFVDAHKMIQVINNLLSNAIKFTPEQGNLWIEARMLDHHEHFYNPEIYKNSCAMERLLPIEISVRDSGIGIPQEAIAKIFERFYQVDSSNTRKYGGTGLGLAIVKSVLDAHGNPILVHSALGEGTTFTFIVPGIMPQDVPSAFKKTHIEDRAQPKYLT